MNCIFEVESVGLGVLPNQVVLESQNIQGRWLIFCGFGNRRKCFCLGVVLCWNCIQERDCAIEGLIFLGEAHPNGGFPRVSESAHGDGRNAMVVSPTPSEIAIGFS